MTTCATARRRQQASREGAFTMCCKARARALDGRPGQKFGQWYPGMKNCNKSSGSEERAA